jgi:hypothetical protein
MGTAVLAPNGDLEFVLALSGDVAFNSRGGLIVGGSFRTTIDLGDGPISAGTSSKGFVILVDRAGQRIWSDLLDGVGVLVNGVAVDSHDDVVLDGYYTGSIDLFGDVFQAMYSGESGRISGAFIAVLDVSGEVVWKQGRASGSEANGVATDARDNAIMTGASTGNAGFNRITQVTRFDTTGRSSGLIFMFPVSGYGRAMSVATDACGSVYTTVNALDLPSQTAPLRVHVVKVTP